MKKLSSVFDLTRVIPVRLTAFAQGDCLPKVFGDRFRFTVFAQGDCVVDDALRKAFKFYKPSTFSLDKYYQNWVYK